MTCWLIKVTAQVGLKRIALDTPNIKTFLHCAITWLFEEGIQPKSCYVDVAPFLGNKGNFYKLKVKRSLISAGELHLALRIVYGEYGVLNCRNWYSAGKNSVWVGLTSHSFTQLRHSPIWFTHQAENYSDFSSIFPFLQLDCFRKNGLIYLTGLCPCWEEFWISPIYSLWMNANQQSSSIE